MGERRGLPQGIRKIRLSSGEARYVVTGYDPAKGGGSREIGRASTLAEARQIKKDFEAGKSSRKLPVTCDEWAARWLDEAQASTERSSSTVALYEPAVKAFGRDFAGVPLRDVSRPLAAAWAHGGTVGRELSEYVSRWHGAERKRSGQYEVPGHRWMAKVIRAMFTDALLRELVDINPFSQLRLTNERSNRRRDAKMLSLPELEHLLDCAVEVAPGYVDMQAMIATAAYTGMRPAELYALRWRHLNFEVGEVTVEQQYRSKTREITAPKNKKPRVIALPDQAAKYLLRLRSLPTFRGDPRPAGPDDPVFLIKSGAPFSHRIHAYYWHPIRAKFGRPGMEFYELRHFCGSFMAEHGASAQDIAWQLGHSDNGALAYRVYVHTYEDASRERTRRLFRDAAS